MIKHLVGTAAMVAAFLVSMTSAANAAIVTFDSHSPMNATFTTTSDGGLDFAFSGSGLAYIFDGSSPNSNGTPNLVMGFTPSDSITITKTGGGLFDLSSIDMAISWYGVSNTETILVNGNSLAITDALATYSLGLMGISSVTITGLPSGTGYWLADNIVYDVGSVPEPGSLALLALGLAGMGVGRRRKLAA